MAESTGLLEILNIGAGHLRFEFDGDNAAERNRAKAVILDMLRRGYSLFVETDQGLRRVKQFSKKHECYIVEEPGAEPAAPKRRRRLPMRTTRATGVGATAGG